MDKSISQDDTESVSSSGSLGSSSATSSPSTPRKSVTFQNIEIREYETMLGDHPCSVGLPLTIEWSPVRLHILSVDEYESAFEDGGKRRGQELRMPESIRKGLLERFHTEEEIKHARNEIRKIKAQRNMSRAMEELETLTTVFQSCQRKYKRWQDKRKGVEPEPAEAWMKEYLKASKDASLQSRRVSWNGESAQSKCETNPSPKLHLRHSAPSVPSCLVA